jgi:hypothetical protein
MADGGPIAPAALSSRLAAVSMDPSQRNTSYNSLHSLSGQMSPPPGLMSQSAPMPRSEPQSTDLSRSNSGGEEHHSGRNSSDIDVDMTEFAELNKVPSYATAVRTPARSRTTTGTDMVPDYQTALSAPRTPPALDVMNDPLSTISEDDGVEGTALHATGATTGEDPANTRNLHLMQARDQTV